MAILIPDMEMPGTCSRCSCANELYERCGVNDSVLSFDDWYERRPDWCPLVEVPKRPRYDADLLRDCGMEE